VTAASFTILLLKATQPTGESHGHGAHIAAGQGLLGNIRIQLQESVHQLASHIPLRRLRQLLDVLEETGLVDGLDLADEVHVVVVALEERLAAAVLLHLLPEHLARQGGRRDIAQQSLGHHLAAGCSTMPIEDATDKAVAVQQTGLRA